MKYFLCLAAFSAALLLGAVEYKFECKSDRHWNLKINEEVTFTARLMAREDAKSPWKAVPKRKVRYIYSENDTVKKSGFLASETMPFTLKVKADKPAWLQLRFYLYDESGKKIATVKRNGIDRQIYGGIGALVEPDKFEPGIQEPADFDAFWRSQRELLNKNPMKPALTPVKFSSPRFQIWEVKIPCPGTRPVSAYMSIPKGAKAKSLPAIVYYHAAGVRSSGISSGLQAIQFNVNAHGILNGQPKEYYVKMRDTELKGYSRAGKEDRETVYFRGMFLRMLRTLDYVKSRPEWNGKTLIVTGGSMGGGQSIAAAALDPQVTLVSAGVPAIGDHAGNLAPVPRRPGWPQYYYAKTADSKVTKATSYYDNIFFARRVKCEVYLTTGLIDGTCPPTSVWLYFKNLKSAKKDLEVYPCGDHGGAPQKKGQQRIREVISGANK